MNINWYWYWSLIVYWFAISQSLAEAMVDGFLLMSLTDRDMVSQLGIDSRVVRKKIMQQILATLDKEHKQTDNWHLRARAQRPKPDVVYLIYDPADVRLAQNLKADLKKKNLQVRQKKCDLSVEMKSLGRGAVCVCALCYCLFALVELYSDLLR